MKTRIADLRGEEVLQLVRFPRVLARLRVSVYSLTIKGHTVGSYWALEVSLQRTLILLQNIIRGRQGELPVDKPSLFVEMELFSGCYPICSEGF